MWWDIGVIVHITRPGLRSVAGKLVCLDNWWNFILEERLILPTKSDHKHQANTHCQVCCGTSTAICSVV